MTNGSESQLDEKSLKLLEKVKKAGKICRFVMLTKGTKITGMRLFRRGQAASLIQKLKQDGAKGSSAQGIVTGRGVKPCFQLAVADGFEQAPVRNLVLKEFLNAATGTTLKPTLEVVEILPDVPEDEDDEEEDEGAVVPSFSDTPVHETPPEPSPEETKYTILLKALKPKLVICNDEEVGDTVAMAKLLGGAVAKAKEGDFAAAYQALIALTGLIKKAQVLIPLKGLKDDLGGDATTGKLLESYSADEIKQLAQDLGGADKLGKIVTAVKPEALKLFCDNLGGAACLSSIVETGFSGDASKLVALKAAFSDDLTPIKTLLNNSGLDSKPKVLGSLLKEGCRGDPARFKVFSNTFSDTDDLAKLAKSINAGGLDGDGAGGGKDASDTLGRVLNQGLGGDPAKLKTMISSFDSEPAKLKTMLTAFNDKPEPLPAKAGERIGKVYAQLAKHGEPPPYAQEIKGFVDEIAAFADKSPKYALA